jgi:hypothetical protein
MSMLRFVPGLVVAACTGSPAEPPITDAETAATTSAVESAVLALAPITVADAPTIAAQYAAAYTPAFAADGRGCATVQSTATTVEVTFACVATTGTLRVEVTSPTTVMATAELTVARLKIDGAAELTVPRDPATPRTLAAELVISGRDRELVATGDASWVANGPCVTLNASGTVAVGDASKTWQIANKTACRE